MFGLPYKKIVAAPEFGLNPALKTSKKFGQSKEISTPAGTAVPAHFHAKHQGRTLEIRYAESMQPELVGNTLVDKYYPLKVRYEGESHLYDWNNEDLCVYIYLHPYNKMSPFRSQFKSPYVWNFKDVELESNDGMAKVDQLTDALIAIKGLSGEKLRIIAKGMGVSGAEKMLENAIKIELSTKAQANPVQFNKDIAGNTVMFKGLIVNGVDRGLFRLDESTGQKIWKWGKGAHNEDPIVTVTGVSSNPQQVLLDFIMGNIHTYYSKIVTGLETLKATASASDYLESQNINLDDLVGDNNQYSGDNNPDPQSQFGGSTGETSETSGSASTTPVPPADERTEEEQFADLRAEWKELTDKAAPPMIKLETLKANVEAKRAELANSQ